MKILVHVYSTGTRYAIVATSHTSTVRILGGLIEDWLHAYVLGTWRLNVGAGVFLFLRLSSTYGVNTGCTESA